MASLIECIPNFSEGRDAGTLDALAAAAALPSVILADRSADRAHNRSVFTLIGPPERLEEAVLSMAETARKRIDLRTHRGGHPRMGAVDVIPFVPLRDATVEDCVVLSRSVGRRIAEELGIPVFLYEQSATADHRRNLADIRRGQFEGMAEKILRPEWRPDFGGPDIHPSAGAVAVGARPPLIAFNLKLDTADLSVAKSVARAVRASGGGMPGLKAIGVLLTDRGAAQVSMNVVDVARAPLYQVFALVGAEAEKRGARVVSGEIVGLAPASALIDCAAAALKLEGFDSRRVLENRLDG